MSGHTPILIVGAGPVGLALAGELGWRGIPCTLIEQTDGLIEQPKMDIVGPRTMEFCRRWGIADWVRDAPYPGDYPQDCVYVTGLNGYELGREPFPGRAQERCPPQSPQKRERVPQDMFDPILQRFVRTFAHVRLSYRTELISFAETADGVIARLRDTATGETCEIDRRLSRRHRRRRELGARTRRHHHERQCGADLHHQRDVPLRRLSLAA